MKDSAEGFGMDSRRSGLVVVDTIALGKAFCYVSYFVSYDQASVVAFALADEFTL